MKSAPRARILAKTPAEFDGSDIVAHAADALAASAIRDIHVVGRRGPHQVSFTPKEIGEMGELERASAVADPGAFPPEADGPRGRQGSPAHVTLPEGWLDDPEDATVPAGAEVVNSGG